MCRAYGPTITSFYGYHITNYKKLNKFLKSFLENYPACRKEIDTWGLIDNCKTDRKTFKELSNETYEYFNDFFSKKHINIRFFISGSHKLKHPVYIGVFIKKYDTEDLYEGFLTGKGYKHLKSKTSFIEFENCELYFKGMPIKPKNYFIVDDCICCT
jgi:hypothetical protein